MSVNQNWHHLSHWHTAYLWQDEHVDMKTTRWRYCSSDTFSHAYSHTHTSMHVLVRCVSLTEFILWYIKLEYDVPFRLFLLSSWFIYQCLPGCIVRRTKLDYEEYRIYTNYYTDKCRNLRCMEPLRDMYECSTLVRKSNNERTVWITQAFMSTEYLFQWLRKTEN
jgi:hypothetical protein